MNYSIVPSDVFKTLFRLLKYTEHTKRCQIEM